MNKGFLKFVILFLTITLFVAGTSLKAEDTPETDRLAMLGRVWGFLKHNHPQTTLNLADWDMALYSAIPRARQAVSAAAFSSVVLDLINQAGPINPLEFPIFLPQPISSDPFFSWMDDARFFTPTARYLLKLIVSNLKAHNAFTSYTFPAGTVDLSTESTPEFEDPSTVEFSLLTLFRFWNHVQLFSPFRELKDQPWDAVLNSLVTDFSSAVTPVEKALAIRKMGAMTSDSAVSLTWPTAEASPWGPFFPPFLTTTIDNQIVVTRVLAPDSSPLAPGDIITAIDGEETAAIRARLTPYLNAANPAVLERDLNRILGRGLTLETHLTLLRQETPMTVLIERIDQTAYQAWMDQDLTGTSLKIITGDIGLFRPDLLLPEDLDSIVARLQTSRSIIFDLRHPLSEFPTLLLDRLLPGSVGFARQILPNQSNPGFFFEGPPLLCGPLSENPAPYTGRIILLVNEETCGAAEQLGMALQTQASTVTVGSMSAGAPGAPASLMLPGGVLTRFSGQGIFYPDGRQVQRVGLTIDIPVSPTRDGIANGRDEAMEQAVLQAKRD